MDEEVALVFSQLDSEFMALVKQQSALGFRIVPHTQIAEYAPPYSPSANSRHSKIGLFMVEMRLPKTEIV